MCAGELFFLYVILYDVFMLREAILATISYYDGLEFPLTGFEVWRYLVNPQRLVKKDTVIEELTVLQVVEEVERLRQAGTLDEEFGMYTLAGRRELVGLRIENEKIAAQKWRLLRRRARWLQTTPWVRGIFVSGSMALGNTTSESDFDMLVIMQSDRLYLGRLFLSVLTSLMGARRTRYERVAPDKFCFNHYITTDKLGIEHESLYNAQTYAHLVPLQIDKTLSGRFFSANIWIHKYVYNFTPWLETVHREIQKNNVLLTIARAMEFILGNALGDWLEKQTRIYQQKRISLNPATHESGGRVVATDTELEFHPRSFERTVLDQYNALARRLKFSECEEGDSGLK